MGSSNGFWGESKAEKLAIETLADGSTSVDCPTSYGFGAYQTLVAKPGVVITEKMLSDVGKALERKANADLSFKLSFNGRSTPAFELDQASKEKDAALEAFWKITEELGVEIKQRMPTYAYR